MHDLFISNSVFKTQIDKLNIYVNFYHNQIHIKIIISTKTTLFLK